MYKCPIKNIGQNINKYYQQKDINRTNNGPSAFPDPDAEGTFFHEVYREYSWGTVYCPPLFSAIYTAQLPMYLDQ